MAELDGLLPEQLEKLRHLPLSRDQVILLLAAANEFGLGLETYLAHNVSGTIVPGEAIPVVFGTAAGLLLLVAGLIALRHRMAANLLATVTLLASIVVGILGSYYHFVRAGLPATPSGVITLDLLVLAPPILGPMVFALVGLLGMSAAWQEDDIDSGRLVLPGGRKLGLPYSKTRAYLLIVSIGVLATLVSSVLDHARTGYGSIWLWIPTLAGVFAMVAAFGLAAVEEPSRQDLSTYIAAMLLLLLVGPLGSILHVEHNLTPGGTVVVERFLRGPPFLAPLLFSNMGVLGLAVLVKPRRVNRPPSTGQRSTTDD